MEKRRAVVNVLRDANGDSRKAVRRNVACPKAPTKAVLAECIAELS